MALWLPIILLSYLFFSIAYFGDKLILSGPPNPKLYTFSVSILSILVVFFIPFISFGLPNLAALPWIFLEALVYILGLYAMFTALEKYDVSRVMTTIGAVQPIAILLLTWAFFGFQAITRLNFLAFALLFAGSVIISFEKKSKTTRHYLPLVIFSSGMFSLDYIFSKFVFLHQPFLQGLIWMRIFSFLIALVLLFDKELRGQVFSGRKNVNKKIGLLFLSFQSAGGIANVLQSLAIALAPVAYLSIVNALRGVQYVFLFVITLLSSTFFPHVLKETMSRKIIIQKTVSITLIVVGLAILVLL